MNHKATQRRQAQLDRLIDYLRQRDGAPSIGELAVELDLPPATTAQYVDSLARTGQVTTRREKRNGNGVKLVLLQDWTPDIDLYSRGD